jgi:hypothetical protein
MHMALNKNLQRPNVQSILEYIFGQSPHYMQYTHAVWGWQYSFGRSHPYISNLFVIGDSVSRVKVHRCLGSRIVGHDKVNSLLQ